jgi:hypothetical protein
MFDLRPLLVHSVSHPWLFPVPQWAYRKARQAERTFLLEQLYLWQAALSAVWLRVLGLA